MKIFIFLLFISTSILFSKNTDYSNEAIIIIDENPNDINTFAAQELQKHLELILNKKILFKTNEDLNKFKYTFYIGNNSNKTHQKNESNYLIENNKIYLFGEDKINKKENSALLTNLNMRNKVGTLFSVYDFLYHELGFRWIKPGNDGIIYKKIEELALSNKSFSWNSDYSFRILRNDIWNYERFINDLKMNIYTPKELRFSKEDVKKREQDELLWKRRMKLDISSKPAYGHAFTKYWELYGEEHPEWFALGENHKRGIFGFPEIKASWQKFCISNLFLQDEIVNNWKRDYKENGNNIYNASINDMNGYCTCDSCKLLDSKDHEHEDFQEKAKTDRYVYFWNSLLKKTKEFNSDAKLIAYAYNEYRYPPNKIILNDNIILGFVPRFDDLDYEIKLYLDKWKEKGLKEIFLRPNDFNDDIGLPMGHEEFIFDKFKVFQNLSLLGLDYDNAYSFDDWNFEGISRYVLLQAFNNPNKSFGEIENEYYDTFDDAKIEIKKYFEYWRNNFKNKRLKYVKVFGGLEGRVNLYKDLERFYTLEDFEKTNHILENALMASKNEKIKELIKNMLISNTHAKLIFETYTKRIDIKELIEFRIKHKKELLLSWPQVFESEIRLNKNFFERLYSKILINFE